MSLRPWTHLDVPLWDHKLGFYGSASKMTAVTEAFSHHRRNALGFTAVMLVLLLSIAMLVCDEPEVTTEYYYYLMCTNGIMV